MAGHSQFKNIMYRKGAQDAKRAKIFTKLIRELTVAAKNGSADPTANPRLRAAITAARNANMSKDTMERAIKRGSGGADDTSYEEVRYEGYGPGGVAIIVEALTDNRNRTASDVRTAFSKCGGSLGESNSVSFMFGRMGVVRFPIATASADAMFEAALGSFLVALLGIIFLPFTTLMYVLLWSPTGLTGWDWLWLLLAFLIDLGGIGSSAYSNRDRVPYYT